MQRKLLRLVVAGMALGMLVAPHPAMAHDGEECPIPDEFCMSTHYVVQAKYIDADGGAVQVSIDDDGKASVSRIVQNSSGQGVVVSTAAVMTDFEWDVDYEEGTGTVSGTLTPAGTGAELITDPTISLTWTDAAYGSPLLPTPSAYTACGQNSGFGIAENKAGKVSGSAWGAATVNDPTGQPLYKGTCFYHK